MNITTNNGNDITIPDLLIHSNCTRLHFWNATKNYHIVTDCIPLARKIMIAHTPDLSCDKATNQCADILSTNLKKINV